MDTPVWANTIAAPMTEAIRGSLKGNVSSYLGAQSDVDFSRWRWGAAHIARFPHPILSRLPYFDDLFGYGVETDGGNDTVNKAGARATGPPEALFADVHGPGYRAVYEPGVDSVFSIAPGPITLSQSEESAEALISDVAERALRLFLCGARAGLTKSGREKGTKCHQ